MYKPLVLLVAVLCVSCTARQTSPPPSQPPTAEPPAANKAQPPADSPKESEQHEALVPGPIEEEPLPPAEEPALVDDPQALKDARVRAEKLGVPQSVLHMLDRDYYGRPELEATRLTAISDAVEAAMDRKVAPGVIRTLLELAVDDKWSAGKIVEQLGELTPSPDNP